MPDQPADRIKGRHVTFGLREAVVLAIVAILIACAVVYYNVT